MFLFRGVSFLCFIVLCFAVILCNCYAILCRYIMLLNLFGIMVYRKMKYNQIIPHFSVFIQDCYLNVACCGASFIIVIRIFCFSSY